MINNMNNNLCVVVSLVLAITITPALAGWLLTDGSNGTRAWWSNGLSFRSLGSAFTGSLNLALRHPRLAILGALILPIIGFLSQTTYQLEGLLPRRNLNRAFRKYPELQSTNNQDQ